MQFDVFISYAWGGPENTAHREWVRLLAAHLKQIGFHVGIDSEVDYGEDLTGFMREIEDAKRVLMKAMSRGRTIIPTRVLGARRRRSRMLLTIGRTTGYPSCSCATRKGFFRNGWKGVIRNTSISRIAIETALFPVPSRLMIYGDG